MSSLVSSKPASSCLRHSLPPLWKMGRSSCQERPNSFAPAAARWLAGIALLLKNSVKLVMTSSASFTWPVESRSLNP